MTTENPEILKLDATSTLHHIEAFISQTQADQLYKHCQQSCPWEQSEIKIFGKRIPIPRLNAWYGDFGYTYSGTSFNATEWTTELLTIKQQIEKASQLTLNSVLANLYRNGNDSMGWHSDDEKSLGPNPQIASLSLGATRRFVLRDKKTKKEKREILLKNGSLLLMLGEVQSNWQHSLPRAAAVKDPRINLTFRLCNSD